VTGRSRRRPRPARGPATARLALAAGAAAAFAAGAAACRASPPVCADLEAALERCGLPVTELDCSRTTRSALEAAAGRVEERGCAGVEAAGEPGAVDPRLCDLAGWPCPGPLVPRGAPPATAHPIVFVAGIDDSPSFDWSPRVLAAFGGRARRVAPAPWATTPERARELWQALLALRDEGAGETFNLVCYAVGGLDCRYLASPGGLAARDGIDHGLIAGAVASVTTIATPHRGTRVAEVAKAALDGGALDGLVRALLGAAAPAEGARPPGAASVALDGLSLDALVAFNRQTPDAPGVYYQSWAGVSHPAGRAGPEAEAAAREHCAGPGGASYLRHEGTRDALNPALLATAPFSYAAGGDDGAVRSGPSDGMVAVESAKWGAFRGCVPADHYDVIGQFGQAARDPLTGFDAADFYAFVAADLAARGF
jgi:triacylglycerol lipase